MTNKERAAEWLAALTSFIRDNQVFPLGANPPEGAWGCEYPQVMKQLEEFANPARHDYWTDEDWGLFNRVIALFTRRADELHDVLRPISHGPVRNSLAASFDPLTYQGLSQAFNFYGNGLCDDWNLFLYRGSDGDVRVIDEIVYEPLMMDRPIPPEYLARLDKGREWFASGERHHLNWKTFDQTLGAVLKPEDLEVPTQDELFEIWYGRSYDDRKEAAPTP